MTADRAPPSFSIFEIGTDGTKAQRAPIVGAVTNPTESACGTGAAHRRTLTEQAEGSIRLLDVV